MTENTGGRPEGTTYGSRSDLDHGLTPREREVLAGIQAGKSNREIGDDLGISRQAVSQIRVRFREEDQVLEQLDKGVPLEQLEKKLRDIKVAAVVKRLRLRGTIEDDS